MFADPQSIVLGPDTFVLAKTLQNGYSSEYHFASATAEITFKIRNTPPTLFKKTQRMTSRHNVEMTIVIPPTAPAVLPTTTRVNFTLDNEVGHSAASSAQMISGIATFLSATNVARLIALES